MEYRGRFERELQNLVIKRIVALIIFSSLIFIIVFYTTTFYKYNQTSNENINYIKDVFSNVYNTNKSYLLDADTQSLASNVINRDLRQEFDNHFYRFNRSNPIRSKYLITDIDGVIVSSDFPANQLTPSLLSYTNAINNNARNLGPNEVYTSIYNDYDGYPDYMMVSTITLQGEAIGFITLFISGDDWSYFTSNDNNYNSVVTDYRNNVIFYNKASLIQNNYKFTSDENHNYQVKNDRYWLDKDIVSEYGITIYSIVHYPSNPETFIALAMISLIGFGTFILSSWISRKMAEKNAHSVNLLNNEIQYITQIEPNHRIMLNSNDEFEDIGHEINTMLDTINDLNRENTELIEFNNAIEISQLTAQINPHFLYNTLEIIRSLTNKDSALAQELILKLTKVLRYSVEEMKSEVTLKDDLEFINQYLFIQNLRFQDNLSVEINIDESHLKFNVPKLLLQPVIENSIKYGFMKKSKLNIEISSEFENDFLVLRIQDNGLGMDEDSLIKAKELLSGEVNTSQSYGLFNISRRLKLQHTDKSKVELRNIKNVGLEVVMHIYQKSNER